MEIVLEPTRAEDEASSNLRALEGKCFFLVFYDVNMSLKQNWE